MIASPPSAEATTPGESNLTWLYLAGLLVATVFVTTVVQGATLLLAWSTEITTMPLSSTQFLRFGWVAPLLSGLLALPLVRARGVRQRAMARTLLWAACLSGLLLIPRTWLSPEAPYAAGLARSAIGLVGGGVLLAAAVRRREAGFHLAGGLPLAVYLAALFWLPWLLFGALGDVLDGLLALGQALALAAVYVGLAAYLLPRLVAVAPRSLWAGGMTLTAAGVLLAGSWGQMDYQALLIGVLPGLGFPLALFGLSRYRGYPLGTGLLLVTTAALAPLALADPLELNLIGLSSHDTAYWSLRATGWNALVGLAALVLVGLFGARLLASLAIRVWTVLAVLSWAGGLMAYAWLGQPGLFGDGFFVVLSAQADLKPAGAIADVTERRAWVYRTLVAQADATQPPLLAWLEARHLPYRRYYLVNGIAVQANAWRRRQMERLPGVDRVLVLPRLRPLPAPAPRGPADAEPAADRGWNLAAIGVPRVWQELGITGTGVTIGHADSGVDATHPALAPGYRGRLMGNDYNWFDPWYGRPEPADESGHGTYTLAIAVGRDGLGVAPGALWFSCVNLARNLGHVAYYLDCMQFMLAPHPPDGDPLRDGRPDRAADISTNSWGCPPALEGCDQQTLWQATAALRAAGIFFVAAAGNEGPACDSLRTPPGNYGHVLSVGAVDRAGNLAPFSNRGPHTQAPDGNTAPDVLAPGVAITSAWPGGGWHTSAGTSAAAPHVAGVAALMWSANPRLRGDVETTERILQETAAPYRGQPDECGAEGEFPDPGTGYGVVDAYAAVRRALELP
jgi:hypothetical protein